MRDVNKRMMVTVRVLRFYTLTACLLTGDEVLRSDYVYISLIRVISARLQELKLL